MADPWTSGDLYVPRPDVPGHAMHTEGRTNGLLAFVCECGEVSEPMHLSNLIGAENRHRIEVQL